MHLKPKKRLPLSGFETPSLPTLSRSYPRHFTFYVAHPIRSIQFFRVSSDLWNTRLSGIARQKSSELLSRVAKRKQLADVPKLDELIREVRGQKVMLDFDLARVYGVETKSLNRAVKRNADRFPKDFMFQMSSNEWRNLKYQIGTSSSGHGGRRRAPYAFTEHGAIMAATVLNSPRAVQMSLFVVRAFLKMRALLGDRRELAQKLASQIFRVPSLAVLTSHQSLLTSHASPPPSGVYPPWRILRCPSSVVCCPRFALRPSLFAPYSWSVVSWSVVR
jgi:hypothetical protein